jgi:flagellar motility protein MotE (MotC chaperone)
MEWQHAAQDRPKDTTLWHVVQEEDVRLSVLAVELEAAQKEIVEARKKLQADIDVALETSAANEKLRAELLAREGQLDKHEEALKEWRATIKADVGAQVAEQEAILQVCRSSALAILHLYILAQQALKGLPKICSTVSECGGTMSNNNLKKTGVVGYVA